MKTPKKRNWRKLWVNWHTWLGIAASIPILIVSLTAILITHEKELGSKNIAINAGWLPGYNSNENINEYLNHIKSLVVTDNITYYGTKIGVISKDINGQLTLLKGTEGKEIRDLLLIDTKLWIASKEGLLLLKNKEATLIKKGDIHGVAIQHNNLYTLEGSNGFSLSIDEGKTWVSKQKLTDHFPKQQLNQFVLTIDKASFLEQLSLQKLVLDMHTGKAFFGGYYVWIWIDLIAVCLVVATIVGIWMWYKRKYGNKHYNKYLKNNRNN